MKKFSILTLSGLLVLTLAVGVIINANSVLAANDNSVNPKVATSDVKENSAVKEKEEAKEDQNLQNVKVKLTKEEAEKIVLTNYQDAKVLASGLEDENGTIAYGVEVDTAKGKLDVKVDANSGKILKAEANDEKEASENENTAVAHDNDNVQEEVEE